MRSASRFEKWKQLRGLVVHSFPPEACCGRLGGCQFLFKKKEANLLYGGNRVFNGGVLFDYFFLPEKLAAGKLACTNSSLTPSGLKPRNPFKIRTRNSGTTWL